MLKMLSVLSQICLSHSGICSVIAFYLGSCCVSVPCIPEPIRKGELLLRCLLGAPGDLGCVASQPVLTHLPIAVHALLSSREQQVRERRK